ncbi:MAG: hypothetical protein ACREET_16805 [Stellaceae bacterium]
MPVAVAAPKNEPTITAEGLVLAGTVLAKVGSDRDGAPALSRDGAPALSMDGGDALKAGFDPLEPRIPAGNGRGSGDWTTRGPGLGQPEGSPASPVTLINYTHVYEMPSDAKAVIPPDGVPIRDKDSPTKRLMAPPRADFHEVYAAGKGIASLPILEQYSRARAAIAQEGAYDFQRDVPQQEFHDPYIHAANYAAGVYMAGAGYFLTAMLALAKLYALRNSKNYDAQDQLGWIQRGWKDATAGRWL